MNKGILKNSIKAIVAFIVVVGCYTNTYGQVVKNIEDINLRYRNEDKLIVKELGVSRKDFKTFVNFYHQRIDSEQYVFMNLVSKGIITLNNEKKYLDQRKSEMIALYKNFEVIKKEFPSSVLEYSTGKRLSGLDTVCNAACDNVDFSNGTLSGWYAFYGINNSDNTSATAGMFVIDGITGGACGSVTQAAGPDLGTNNDYQVKIMSGSGKDALIPSIPVVSPYGGKYSVRLGDTIIPYQGVAILSQRFTVTPTNKIFTYQYAVVLDNPASSRLVPPHTYYQQPFFRVTMLDQNGDTIKGCGSYNVTSGGASKNGFSTLIWNNPFDGNEKDSVEYKNWSYVFVPLDQYIGQCITVQFTAADCSLGGHFGYAYVEASCSGLANGIIASSPTLCGQKSITLSGPLGGSQYLWSGPTNGIIGTDTARVIQIDSAGIYRLIITPFTGTGCNDTLYDTVGKSVGPIPKPFFSADTICSGNATVFTNLSAPGAGAGVSFAWDFYNIGSINDTTTNPMWTYTNPGTYSVTLHEVSNGCGADTTLTIKVDSNATPSFTYTHVCVGSSVSFTNKTTGGVSYLWEFGDGSTSDTITPTHIYPGSGPYVATLIAKSFDGCIDSVKDSIYLTIPTKLTINGNDTICAGTNDKLTVVGGKGPFNWTPGALTGRSITVSPAVTTTYSVTGGGTCGGDTSFVVTVLTAPTPIITAKTTDTICSGLTDTLVASKAAGVTYLWSNAATTDTILVSPAITTTYTLTESNAKCSTQAVEVVTVISSSNQAITASPDTICIGNSSTLTASGGAHYLWSTSATTSTITVSPSIQTTYSVTITSTCTGPVSKSITVYPFAKPSPSITSNPANDSLCSGSSATLTANGGVGATIYKWSNGSSSSSITITPALTTTYTVVESNATCSDSAMVIVVVEKNVKPVIVLDRDSICKGSVDTLSVTGGPSYVWNTGATTNYISVTPASTFTYSVTVHSFCYDTVLSSVLHVVPVPMPAINSSLGDSICANTSDVLTANTVSAGTTYLWSPSNSTSGTLNVTLRDDSTFTLTEKDGGCSNSTSLTIKTKTVPPITITGLISPVCSNETETLTASANSASGYSWNINGTFYNVNPVTFQPNSTETLNVSVTNSTGCPDYKTDTVIVNVVKPVTACCPDTIALGASTHLTASGVSSYAWSPVGTVGCFSCANTVVTPTTTTTYTVTGTDSNGCKSEFTVVVYIECQNFQVPNVFTPNNDNINDLFVIHAEHEPDYSIEIFDRWGAKVFSSSNGSDYWNGKVNNTGADAPDGVYYYIIKSSCNDDNYDKHGFVEIIRK